MQQSSREERKAAALTLWNAWTADNLGTLPKQLQTEHVQTNKRLARLERECGELAARVQKRLEVSKSIRNGHHGSNTTSDGHASMGIKSARDALYLVRERGRAKADEAAKQQGVAQRSAQDGGDPASPAPQGAKQGQGKRQRPQSATPRLASGKQTGPAVEGLGFPAAAAAVMNGASLESALQAASEAAGRQTDDPASLQRQIQALKLQQEAHRASMQVQQDLEAQLRGTIDLLRVRVHTLTEANIQAQRELQVHSVLGPLFERLAEKFPFKSPEEVVDRLELLENDRLGSMEQLTRAQEEVGQLRQRLAEATKQLENAKTAAQVESVRSVSRLQTQNEELRGEMQAMQGQTKRLHDRQQQLVHLQSAVMELYTRCQLDARFPTSKGDDSECLDVQDPLTMIRMVQEFVSQHSGAMAHRHLLDVQRVANRIWQHHFSSREELKGDVLATLAGISDLADKMAAQLAVVQAKLEESQGVARQLSQDAKKGEVRERRLEAELERRKNLLRQSAGMPRSQRASMTAMDEDLDDGLATVMSRGGDAGGSARRARPASAPARRHSDAAAAEAASHVAPSRDSAQASTSSPSSAPQRRKQRPASARASSRPSGSSALGASSASSRTPHAAAAPSPYGQLDMRSLGPPVPAGPGGVHWQQHLQASGVTTRAGGSGGGNSSSGRESARGMEGSGGGGSNSSSGRESVGGMEGSSGGGGKWGPPNRPADEAAFLNRLQRSASASAATGLSTVLGITGVTSRQRPG